MTTAEATIEKAFQEACTKYGWPTGNIWPMAASIAVAALLSADESVRLELAGRLNPWRPIETAPRDGTMILTRVSWLPYAKPLFWATYANDWRCPANEDAHEYDPTHWLPLPAPPSEDK